MTSTTAAPSDVARPQRPLRADALRNQKRILAAAAELFASRGLDITLDDVAAHAGVGVGTVYRRFANKQELIIGVFDDHFERLAEQADIAVGMDNSWDGLVHFCEFLCESMARNRGLGEVMVSLDIGQDHFICVRERIQPRIDRILQRTVADGEVRPDVTPSDFFAIVHMVDWIADFARPVNPNVWRRYLVLLLDGVRAEGKPRTTLTVAPLTDDEVHEAKQTCLKARR